MVEGPGWCVGSNDARIQIGNCFIMQSHSQSDSQVGERGGEGLHYKYIITLESRVEILLRFDCDNMRGE